MIKFFKFDVSRTLSEGECNGVLPLHVPYGTSVYCMLRECSRKSFEIVTCHYWIVTVLLVLCVTVLRVVTYLGSSKTKLIDFYFYSKVCTSSSVAAARKSWNSKGSLAR